MSLEFDIDQSLQTLHAKQGADWETIAGYEVYVVDCTPNERPEAEKLEDEIIIDFGACGGNSKNCATCSLFKS